MRRGIAVRHQWRSTRLSGLFLASSYEIIASSDFGLSLPCLSSLSHVGQLAVAGCSSVRVQLISHVRSETRSAHRCAWTHYCLCCVVEILRVAGCRPSNFPGVIIRRDLPQDFEKRLSASSCLPLWLCLSTRPLGATQLQLDGFSSNFIFLKNLSRKFKFY